MDNHIGKNRDRHALAYIPLTAEEWLLALEAPLDLCNSILLDIV
jgi:hypothetical protein